MIYLDDRESASTIAAVKAKLTTAVTVTRLDLGGDFVLYDTDGCAMAIERKRADDFLASLVKDVHYPRGRVREQLERMYANYDYVTIILEGLLPMAPNGKILLGDGSFQRESGWRHSSALAILYDEQVHWGVPVIPTAGLPETIDFVRVMNNRAERGCFEGKKNGRKKSENSTGK